MPQILIEKQRKPPACDACKAKKYHVCTTTPVPRGRPPKNRLPACSSLPPSPPQSLRPRPSPPLPVQPVYKISPACPPLTPEFVAHCLEAVQSTPQYNHPLIATTSIDMDIRAVSFQLHLLPPQSRVLALCIICCASLTSFHPSMLGDGPRPESFVDQNFFLSSSDLFGCGIRRGPAYRALLIEALKAAWELGIILQPSNENAASCYLLDLVEQCDFTGISRPWADAYISHIRALAPIWRSENSHAIPDSAHWVGYLMGDALISARNRTPMLATPNDQLLFCGPPPPSLEALMASLTNSTSVSSLWGSLNSYLYHVIDMVRQLSETVAGDYPRLGPLSEGAALDFLSSLSLMHAILCLLLDHIDRVIATADINSPLILEDMSRTCAYGAISGFTGLVLPFYRELVYREGSDVQVHNQYTYDRLGFLRGKAHDMAILAVRQMARAIRYLPKIHYMPVHWQTVLGWAEFCLEEAQSGVPLSPEFMQDVETITKELKGMGYSLEVASAPKSVALIERLEEHVSRAIADMFLPPELPLVARNTTEPKPNTDYEL
ncbi:hypothetical protein DFH08DRAFT_1028653 [Mycena albidolilacea]|uniref:Uncharacterized protein n=1 Tax=Mycena albidolilacea TaxID=1033008 RepID=A0AAD6ZIS9_9AGAR|nr:hypothetical protein DFH08DRAFT_1028653 [Mycena albidolilacea]